MITLWRLAALPCRPLKPSRLFNLKYSKGVSAAQLNKTKVVPALQFKRYCRWIKGAIAMHLTGGISRQTRSKVAHESSVPVSEIRQSISIYIFLTIC
jgi:hypothetical protein